MGLPQCNKNLWIPYFVSSAYLGFNSFLFTCFLALVLFRDFFTHVR